MAKSVNKVILLGNVGKDPEIRSTGGGTMVANFRPRHQRPLQDPQGNWQDRTEWHNIVAFGALAEIVRDYVKKGSKLFIEGRIQTRNWEDKECRASRSTDRNHRQRTSLLSGREDGGSSSRSSNAPSNIGDRNHSGQDRLGRARLMLFWRLSGARHAASFDGGYGLQFDGPLNRAAWR